MYIEIQLKSISDHAKSSPYQKQLCYLNIKSEQIKFKVSLKLNTCTRGSKLPKTTACFSNLNST